MIPTVRARLFGPFELSVGGRPLTGLTDTRVAELVALLLLDAVAAPAAERAGPVARRRVAALLWPDSPDRQALTNLRHLLHTLRGRQPAVAAHLEITAATVRWRDDQPYSADVADFARELATDAADASGRSAALTRAVGLYRGELLAGCEAEWLAEHRRRLRERHRDALAELCASRERIGDLDGALALAERLRGADPISEDGYRRLMRLHAARGDRARALAAFHECSEVLRTELGVGPDAAIRAAYQALLGPSSGPAGVGAAPGDGARARAVERPSANRPPLVGRRAEQARLIAAWESARAGRAQLVLVSGEAGVGKSRLLEELRAWCARRGTAVAEARCCRGGTSGLAYAAVADWLRAPAMRAGLDALDRPRLAEISRLLPELAADRPDLVPPGPLPEQEYRHRFLSAVAGGLLSATGTAGLAGAPSPLLLVLDDAHHADPRSIETVEYLLTSYPTARLLVAAAVRAGELDGTHPVTTLARAASAAGRCRELTLAPLDERETGLLLEAMTGSPPPAAELARRYAETEGNPLFVVEGARSGRSGPVPLSPRVQAVIAERLGQLSPPARALAETAALIGREFPVGVLADLASENDEDAFVGALDELWRRGIIRERASHAYDFRHDLIREVAAAAVPPARRRRLHARIAAALERADVVHPAAAPGQIAAHHEAAGQPEAAAAAYVRAAEAAGSLHAHTLVIEALERASRQLDLVPASPERDRRELALHTALLAPLAAVQGYATGPLVDHQRAARALAGRLGAADDPALLRSLAMTASTRSDFAAARTLGQALRAAGERDGDPVLRVEGAFVLGIAAFWRAEFAAAHEHLRAAVEDYRPETRHAHLVHYGNDPKVSCLSRLGNTLWFLGRAEDARAAHAAALAWADEIDHAYSTGIVHWFGALLALDMGDDDELRRSTAALTTLTAGHLSQQLALAARALRGLLAVRDGRPRAGLAAVADAVRASRGNEAPGLHASLIRVHLAAALDAGDVALAAALADGLLGMDSGAAVWRAEALRRRSGPTATGRARARVAATVSGTRSR